MNNTLKHELLYIISFFLFVAFVGHDLQAGKEVEAQAQPQAVEGDSTDVGQASGINITSQPPMVATESAKGPLEDATDVERYVFEVFGEDYDKAMLLLRGNDDCGGENKTLNTYAVNDNTAWGGIGRDRGIFQINSVFHPLTDEQAFDYKQNISYAYRMFLNDDRTFVRWTAGRCLHI